jgi:hypothetical protein
MVSFLPFAMIVLPTYLYSLVERVIGAQELRYLTAAFWVNMPAVLWVNMGAALLVNITAVLLVNTSAVLSPGS